MPSSSRARDKTNLRKKPRGSPSKSEARCAGQVTVDADHPGPQIKEENSDQGGEQKGLLHPKGKKRETAKACAHEPRKSRKKRDLFVAQGKGKARVAVGTILNLGKGGSRGGTHTATKERASGKANRD